MNFKVLRYPLHTAIIEGDLQRAQELMSPQVDLNEKNLLGLTPLHLAAIGGHADIQWSNSSYDGCTQYRNN